MCKEISIVVPEIAPYLLLIVYRSVTFTWVRRYSSNSSSIDSEETAGVIILTTTSRLRERYII
jgi:hypothetical protein